MSAPIDRKGEFEPQILKKIRPALVRISTVSRPQIPPSVESRIRCRQRMASAVIGERVRRGFMSTIHYRKEQIAKEAVYVAIGISLDGEKDNLGM